MRSSSIWVPMFIAGAGAAAVTALVVTQRQSRFSARAEGARSDPASHRRTDESAAEAVLAEVRNEFPTLDFDPDPETARGLGEPLPPSVPERGEAYDAVNADDLGAEWLTRATESLPVNRAARSGGEFDELTTLDLLDEDPVSLPVVEVEVEPESSTDATGLVESEAVLADRNARALEAPLERPRPPPHVFDTADLLQNDDAPSDSGRRG